MLTSTETATYWGGRCQSSLLRNNGVIETADNLSSDGAAALDRVAAESVSQAELIHELIPASIQSCGQGGEKDVPFDDARALDAVATIWQKAVYWRAEPG